MDGIRTRIVVPGSLGSDVAVKSMVCGAGEAFPVPGSFLLLLGRGGILDDVLVAFFGRTAVEDFATILST